MASFILATDNNYLDPEGICRYLRTASCWFDSVRFLLVAAAILLGSLLLSSLDMFRIWLSNKIRLLTKACLICGYCSVLLCFIPLTAAIYLTFACFCLVTLLAVFYLYFSLIKAVGYSAFIVIPGLALCWAPFAILRIVLPGSPVNGLSDYLLSLFSTMAAFLLTFSLAYRTYQEKGRIRAKRQATEGLKRYFDLYHSATEGLFTSTLEGQLLAANPCLLPPGF